jgi:hypothetical protein
VIGVQGNVEQAALTAHVNVAGQALNGLGVEPKLTVNTTQLTFSLSDQPFAVGQGHHGPRMV